ncbi:hypothetical protein MNB_SV-14-1789 [hydrothermal vent metagenome]|uniref:DUF1835 domain-containing protein n=1 Tax=hydrothermal vent metagenome TaxID=652676 RepID=A0A1W1CFU0_9ZZZZ
MPKILNIVNGDVTVEIIKKANINGDFLPWRDFLHEGPVPQTVSIEELSKIRANFIHKQGFGSLEEIEKEFQERDEKLKSYHKYKKIILWFEHDLYDQLQLLQILSWFHNHDIKNIKLYLISIKNYLGESSEDDVRKLLLYEERVGKAHLDLAKKAWSAFTDSTPIAWFKLLEEDTHLLPFLRNAIIRMLEEYPSVRNGLSRSEHQALFVISKGIKNPKEIFQKCQKYEKQKFMGEVVFWKILDAFIENRVISSKENGQILQITKQGKKVLNGEINYLHIKPIKRWIGGTKLTNDNVWCWNIKERTINRYYYSKTLSSLLLFNI